MARSTVTIEKDGKEAQVLPSSVKVYVRKGWTVKEVPENLPEEDQNQLALAKDVEVEDGDEDSPTTTAAAPTTTDPVKVEPSKAEKKAASQDTKPGAAGQ